MNDLDRDVVRMQRGQAAGAVRTALDMEIAERQAQIDKSVYALIRSGEILDPQRAVQLWMEKAALARLMHDLERKEKVGQGAAKRIKPAMEGK